MTKKCFVIMPFGQKTDPSGQVIDFDDIYEFMIRGAIEDDLKIECIRCDKINEPGLIHRDMILNIYDADVAIVDITTTNANVFYELGVRHALKKGVTVVVRRSGTQIPFNIRDLRVIDYDPGKFMSVVGCRKTIRQFVEAGLRLSKNDSLVHEYLDLRITSPREPIAETSAHLFSIKGSPSKAVGLITGDIQNVNIADIWVNSENTNMQMARFYDGSVSGVIRYMGATKDDKGNVVDDVISNELQRVMGKDRYVDPGTVIPTGAGELVKSNGVKRVFHAAAVQGVIGEGYFPVKNFQSCVRRAMELVDLPDKKNQNCSSLLFPLFGTGTGKGDVEGAFRKMLETALGYFRAKKNTQIDRVYFLNYSQAEFRTCMGIMENSENLTKL